MKFTGRIISVIITLLTSISITSFHILGGTNFYIYTLIGMAVCIPSVWWIGKQYDKLDFYQKQIMQKEEVLEGIFNNINACIYSIDLKTGKARLSVGAEKLYGYKEEDFDKNPSLWNEVIHPDDIEALEEKQRKLFEEKNVKAITHEHRIVRSDGQVIWVDGHLAAGVNAENEPTKLNVFLYDITEHKNAEKKIRYMAYHDNLTSLPNRLLFGQYLEKALAHCVQSKTNLAIMFIDIDRFKLVNDTFGHATGDILLKAVAKRLEDSARVNDIVSRHSGDEFIILLEKVKKEDTVKMAEKIIDQFSFPFYINGRAVFVSPSIGISQYAIDGEDQETLIRKADQAMYFAKQNGKNNYQFYESMKINKGSRLADNISLESELRKAIKNNELELYYQPLVSIDSHEIYGAEALVRWNHPRCGLVPPSEFLPVAEATGLILQIGEWVLRSACAQNKQWQKEGLSHIKVSVNISGLQFQSENLIETVEAILTETGLDPTFLDLEIIEDVIQNLEDSMTKFNKLKSMRTKISIDDFGTGYSSLSRLKYIPVDFLKIDKSFTWSIGTHEENLVKTIIEMGHNLNIGIIAEGIENKAQADFLKENGCKYGQGFFYGKPLPAEQFEKILRKQSQKKHVSN